MTENPPDTVGQPQIAENCASHMPSLKAQEHGKSKVLKAAVPHGRRMTNSIPPLSAHETRGARLLAPCARKLSPQIKVKLVDGQEVFGQHVDGIVSQSQQAILTATTLAIKFVRPPSAMAVSTDVCCYHSGTY